jgi:hypothetical protein
MKKENNYLDLTEEKQEEVQEQIQLKNEDFVGMPVMDFGTMDFGLPNFNLNF